MQAKGHTTFDEMHSIFTEAGFLSSSGIKSGTEGFTAYVLRRPVGPESRWWLEWSREGVRDINPV